MRRDDWDEYIRTRPEPKLELVGGRLEVGNGLAGSRVLLHDIMDGWGLAESLTLTPPDLFWPALRRAFARFDPPADGKPLSAWRAWAAQLAYQPELPAAGPMADGAHRHAAQDLALGLFVVAAPHGRSLSRDCVIRLRDDGFTPDVFFYRPSRRHLQTEGYFDGPPDWVIEVTLPGHDTRDTAFKRGVYEAAGVGEYWIIDPLRRAATFLRQEGGRFREVFPDGSRMRPACAPAISLRLDRLWDESAYHRQLFDAEGPASELDRSEAAAGEWEFGTLPFRPAVRLDPAPLQFGEYISWCPRAKFEVIDGKPLIDGTIGTRNVLGMLLRTFGLAEAMTLFSPARWVEARSRFEELIDADADRKAEAVRQARKGATFLRERSGVGRVVLIGDAVSPAPWGPWSFIDVVYFDPVKAHSFELYQEMTAAGVDDRVELRHVDRLLPAQETELENGGLEL